MLRAGIDRFVGVDRTSASASAGPDLERVGVEKGLFDFDGVVVVGVDFFGSSALLSSVEFEGCVKFSDR